MSTKKDLAEAVVVERAFNAHIDEVWKAITSEEALKEWFFDSLDSFRPEVGFEFGFVGENKGVKYVHRCKVTEVIPGRKIAYSWRYEKYEGDSLVTLELFAEGDKTRVRLTHKGLETFPKTPDFAKTNFETGWTSLIGTSLKEFVEKTKSKPGDRNNHGSSNSTVTAARTKGTL
jgi:uncharacterized protein YndB with AHSA1/START domain